MKILAIHWRAVTRRDLDDSRSAVAEVFASLPGGRAAYPVPGALTASAWESAAGLADWAAAQSAAAEAAPASPERWGIATTPVEPGQWLYLDTPTSGRLVGHCPATGEWKVGFHPGSCRAAGELLMSMPVEPTCIELTADGEAARD